MFLEPFLTNTFQIDQQIIQYYFIIFPMTAMILSPFIGVIVTKGMLWAVFVTTPLVGLIGCTIMGILTYLDAEYIENWQIITQTSLIVSLICLGYCSTAVWISESVVIDDIFALYSPNDSNKGYRVIMCAWNCSICYMGGRCFGAAIIGGVIFDKFGYEGTVIAHFMVYLIMCVTNFVTLSRFKSKTAIGKTVILTSKS